MHGHVCLSTHVVVRDGQVCYVHMGNLVSMLVDIYICTCDSVCVYVYEYDCFMYVHTCTYYICMHVMTMYSAVRIPLVSNCAI